jgi:hypothetical protein
MITDSLHSLPDCECLLFHCDEWRMKNLCSLNHGIPLRMNPTNLEPESESCVTTDGQSASLSWNKAPIWGLRPDFYNCQTVAGFVDVRHSLCREDGCVVYNCCWPSPAQSFSGPSPLGLATIFYCLRFETSLYVASYNSQGYGVGIRTRLHPGFCLMNELSFITLGESNRDHHHEYLHVILPMSRECVFGEPLTSKWTSPSVRCYSGFQAMFTEPLPRKLSYSSQ